MSVTKMAKRRFRVELLEERIAPGCLLWDAQPDQTTAESSGAVVGSASTGLEPVKESGMAASPVLRGFQGTVLAHLGGTRCDRVNQSRPPLAPHQVTELLDDIDRRFNQPLPKNPLELLEELDQTYNQPLPQNPLRLLDEVDQRFNQPAAVSQQFPSCGSSL